jgi:hypothetical protein
MLSEVAPEEHCVNASGRRLVPVIGGERWFEKPKKKEHSQKLSMMTSVLQRLV